MFVFALKSSHENLFVLYRPASFVSYNLLSIKPFVFFKNIFIYLPKVKISYNFVIKINFLFIFTKFKKVIYDMHGEQLFLTLESHITKKKLIDF